MSNIFISYSHEDVDFLELLLKFLSGGLFQKDDLWSDQRIDVGQNWRVEIAAAIEAAKVVILLISQDYLNSRFISSEEVPSFLRRRREEGMAIFPLLLRHSTWVSHPWLAEMQLRPLGGVPLAAKTRNQKENALAEFAVEIARLLKPSSNQLAAETYFRKGEDRAPATAGTPVEARIALPAWTEGPKPFRISSTEMYEYPRVDRALITRDRPLIVERTKSPYPYTR